MIFAGLLSHHFSISVSDAPDGLMFFLKWGVWRTEESTFSYKLFTVSLSIFISKLYSWLFTGGFYIHNQIHCRVTKQSEHSEVFNLTCLFSIPFISLLHITDNVVASLNIQLSIKERCGRIRLGPPQQILSALL